MTNVDLLYYCPHCLNRYSSVTRNPLAYRSCAKCHQPIDPDGWLTAKQAERRLDKRRAAQVEMARELAENPLLQKREET